MIFYRCTILGILLLLTCQGCTSPEILEKGIRPARPANKALRQLPEYQKAVSLFSRGDKSGAKRVLATLLQRPKLSPEERAYLEMQRARCEEASLHPSESATDKKPLVAAATPGRGNCGPRALQLAAQALGRSCSLEKLTQQANPDTQGTSLAGLRTAALSVGLKATGVQVDREALARLKTPAVAWWQGNHFVAVLKVHQSPWDGTRSALLHDPNEKEARTVPLDTLLAQSGGILLVLTQ